MSNNSLQDRIDELESRVAFQDDTLHTLNLALGQQQQSILRLERSIEKLLEQLEEAREQPLTPLDEPPPPHY